MGTRGDDLLLAGRLTDAVGRQRRQGPVGPTRKGNCFSGLRALPGLGAMVILGMANSRMKDFFDLWMLAEQFAYDGEVLARAIRATFDRRRTPLPGVVPLALTDEFCADRAKQSQWRAFAAKGNLATRAPPRSELAGILRLFLCPPMEAFRAALPFRQRWKPAGPWRA
jgi:hypothetical protein